MSATKDNDSLHVQLRSLIFSGGRKVELRPDSVVVLVGPNNAGKTSTLREVLKNLRDNETGPVLEAVNWQKDGDLNALQAWLDANVHVGTSQFRTGKVWGWLSDFLGPAEASHYWTSSSGIGSLAPIFVNLLSVEKRL